MAKLLPGYSGNIRALNNTVGLLTTLPTKHSNLVTALKDYPWMMTGSGRPQSVSDVKRLLDIISLEGWGAFWRGMRSGLARDCVFGGIFFSTWQFLHQAMLERKAVGMNTPPSMYPWRGGFLNGNRPERDLRDGPGSTLQIGISYFVAYDCGWHGVELHPLWLSVVIFLQLTDCFLREGNKDVRGIEELSKPGVIRKKYIFFSLEQAWRKLSHINVG